MLRKLTAYASDDSGAVTVDWVVLTAAVVGLGFAALSAIRTATGGLTTKIADHLNSVQIQSTF